MEANSQMQAEPQKGKYLSYLTVFPEDYDPKLEYPLIIMLHGFGANMYDLADLASVIESRGYLYLCPNAPIPVQVGPGMLGFAWTQPGSDDPEQAIRSEQKLEGFLQEVMDQHPASKGRSALLGFSQGGGLTYRFGLPRPDRFAALVALSCSIRDVDEMRQRLPGQRDQPIFMAHGLKDNPERARISRAFLQSEGYDPYYREYDMGHEINQDVLGDLVPWLHSVLPPMER